VGLGLVVAPVRGMLSASKRSSASSPKMVKETKLVFDPTLGRVTMLCIELSPSLRGLSGLSGADGPARIAHGRLRSPGYPSA